MADLTLLKIFWFTKFEGFEAGLEYEHFHLVITLFWRYRQPEVQLKAKKSFFFETNGGVMIDFGFIFGEKKTVLETKRLDIHITK